MLAQILREISLSSVAVALVREQRPCEGALFKCLKQLKYDP